MVSGREGQADLPGKKDPTEGCVGFSLIENLEDEDIFN